MSAKGHRLHACAAALLSFLFFALSGIPTAAGCHHGRRRPACPGLSAIRTTSAVPELKNAINDGKLIADTLRRSALR